ncbi:MAG: glycoside hydrolase family 2 protein [Kofleriaceae bacterium]
MSVRGVSGHTRVAIEHGWEVACTPPGQAEITSLDRLRWSPAKVPGTVAGALEPRDYDGEDVWWRAPMGAELTAGCVLGFDGIATLWDAWLDGVHVASGDSMWERREVVIEHVVKELVIRCRALTPELAKKRPRPRWKVPMLEQQQLRWIRTTLLGRTPGWSPPYPAVGPWRPVWIEQRTHRVGDVRITARIDGEAGLSRRASAAEGQRGVIDVIADLPDASAAQIVITRGALSATAALVLHDERWRASAVIEDVALWWPHTHGEPARYAVKLEVRSGDHAYEIDLGHTGFRTITVTQDGDFAVRVNGIDVFCRGACWTPLDTKTLAATPAQYDAAIAQMCDAGMNMLRIAGTMTYEADALYDALDAHGVLLWQDLMFANMDYPDDPAFVAKVRVEVESELARLQGRPALAVICGNSEGEQQAAMWGAPRDRWAPPLFHQVIPDVIATIVPEAAYVPSSTHGGAFPHASNRGPSSYYGVGAYLRPLEDARRAEVVFASECLAFANVPAASGMPEGLRVHHAGWKQRSPRDLGAGWDFDDVRDHYVQRVFGVDATALRVTDHERYLELGKFATGEAMARTYGEWRRARSVTRGALIWFLRDLWPGAGWGVVDANGRPKACWYALRRALAPVALAITDEGTNGLALHLANDTAQPVTRTLELALWRGGDTQVGRAEREVTIGRHAAMELAAADLFDGFYDLSYAYRFGPNGVHVIHARFGEAEQFWFPAGMPSGREHEVGLSAQQTGDALTITTKRFAQFVTIDLPGWLPADDGFHLAPNQARVIGLKPTGAAVKPGTVQAVNAEAGSKIETSP